MIEVRGLTKTLSSGSHRVEILRGIDLTVNRREVIAIEGPSGSGKSTLLGLLAGFDSPTSGSIRLEGEEITQMDEDELALLRGRKLGFVFQSYNLIPTLTAEENVMLPIELRGDAQGAQERARELLVAVGLQERNSHYPAQLSGGEQQRVAFCRAVLNQPPLLLADEPTGNLDDDHAAVILDELRRQADERGAAVVLVTHRADAAARADRCLRLQAGRLEPVRAPTAAPGRTG
jgi:putative ABC transport system ATP-binding protein